MQASRPKERRKIKDGNKVPDVARNKGMANINNIISALIRAAVHRGSVSPGDSLASWQQNISSLCDLTIVHTRLCAAERFVCYLEPRKQSGREKSFLFAVEKKEKYKERMSQKKGGKDERNVRPV